MKLRAHLLRNALLVVGLFAVACGSRADGGQRDAVAALSQAVTSSAQASGDVTTVTPTVNCVFTRYPQGQNGAPAYSAVFGYSSTSVDTVVAPIGDTNKIVDGSSMAFGRGQPIAFENGAHDASFVIDFGSSITWTLGSNSVTASTSSPACATSPGPDGATVTYGAGTSLVRPDPQAILPGAILNTETGATAGTAIGSLHGSFHVTGDGAAAYGIPLWTPPALMGLGPSLSLAYGSRNGRGVAGVGWDLTGFGISRISRCAKTIAQDGDPTPIDFTDNDAFCLDGQRLLLENSDESGIRTYALERDPFTRITFDPNVQGFHLFQRDGRVLHYGTTGNSRHTGVRYIWQPDSTNPNNPKPANQSGVVYAWGLASVVDPSGNHMDVQYSTIRDRQSDIVGTLLPGPCTEMLVSRIDYTATASQAARRWVEVQYEDAPPAEATCRYVSGFGLRSRSRLQYIGMHGPVPTAETNDVLRSYSFAYDFSGLTNRSLLKSVQECDGHGVCMNPTSFGYEAGNAAYRPLVNGGPDNAPCGAAGPVYYDVNGDGRDDITFVTMNPCNPQLPGQGPFSWATALSDGTRFGAATLSQGQWTNLTPKIPFASSTMMASRDLQQLFLGGQSLPPSGKAPVRLPISLVADLDGNGEMDQVFLSPTSANATYKSWAYNQTDLGPRHVFGTNYPEMYDPPWLLTTDDADPSLNEYVAPIDGTGKTAFLFRAGNDKFTVPHLMAVTVSPSTGKPHAFETTLPVGDKWSYVSNPYCDNGPFGWFGDCQDQIVGFSTSTFYWFFVDLNGDGNAEALQVPIQGGVPKVAFNTGAGFGPLQSFAGADNRYEFALPTRAAPQPPAIANPAMQTVVGDWNGDGLPDLLITNVKDLGGGASSVVVATYTARGAFGMQADFVQDESGQPLSVNIASTLDLDGDGQVDFVTPNGTVYRHLGNKPDVLTAVHDGLGKDTTISYAPISNSDVYTPATDCVYPKNCAARDLWVVQQYAETTDWGASGKPATADKQSFGTYRYTYGGGRSDVNGRGWLGFSFQSVTDQATGANTITYFNNDETDVGYGYPQAGLPQAIISTSGMTADGVSRVLTTTNQYEVVPVLSGRGVIVRQKEVESIAEERAPSGTTFLADKTTTFGYDVYNNLTDQNTTWSSGEQRTSHSTFTQNTSGDNWLLSLLQKTDETSNVPGQPAVTRTHAFNRDPSTGLVKDETIQAGGGPAETSSITYDRNAAGQVTHLRATATDPVQSAQTITRESWVTYDEFDGLFPASVTNALGHTNRSVFHPGLGVLAFAQDANGVTAHHRYDRFGRPRERRVDGHGLVTIHYEEGYPFPGYDLTIPTGPNGPGAVPGIPGLFSIETDQAGGGHSVVTYNALGDEVARAIRNHDGDYSYVETSYTALPGQVASTTLPFRRTTTKLSNAYEYDRIGRHTKTTLPDGAVVLSRYNQRAVTTVDPKGCARTQVLDELGRLARVDEDSTPNPNYDPTQPPQRPATAASTTYSYGPFGVLNDVSVIDRGGAITRVASMLYDELGRRTLLSDGDSGASSTTYNAFGEPMSVTDANGDSHTYERDAIGRTVLDQSTRDGATRFEWDTAMHGVGALGSTLSADQIVTRHRYDAFGRGTGKTWQIAGAAYSLDTEIDAFGRASTLTYPAVSGERLQLTFGFDKVGALNHIDGGDPSASLTWNATAWQVDGQLTREAFGSDGLTTRAYDPQRGWLTNIASTTHAETIQNVTYGHDPNGNVNERDDAVFGTKETFDHDWLNRVTSWTFSSQQGLWSTTYGYSDLGNLTSRSTSGDGGLTYSYTYGSRDASGTPGDAGVHAVVSVNHRINGITAGSSYAYDAKGNQFSGAGRNVAYTSFNLPREITNGSQTTQFQYDAEHHRALKKTLGGASTIYAGPYERRDDGQGNITHVFHAPGEVAQVQWRTDASGVILDRKVAYLHEDHLGSIGAVSGTGTPTTQLRYDPFGKRIDPLNPTAATQSPADITTGFAGLEHDDELGFVNMNGRLYDARIGRFISTDPLVFAPTSSQGWNRYSYVLNRPLSLVDPSGFSPAQGDGHVGLISVFGSCRQVAKGVVNCDGYDEKYIRVDPPSTGTRTSDSNGSNASNTGGAPLQASSTVVEIANDVPSIPPLRIGSDYPSHARREAPILETPTRGAQTLEQGHEDPMEYDAMGAPMRKSWNLSKADAAVLAHPWAENMIRAGERQEHFITAMSMVPSLVPGVAEAEGVEILLVKGIPRGFADADAFAEFSSAVKAGLADAGYADVEVLFQGSSVTGKSFRTGVAFDVGRVSDYDIALAGRSLLGDAEAIGVALRSGGTRTAPLTGVQAQLLGLGPMQGQLSNLAGRPVNFMIYQDAATAASRAPSILVR